MEFTFDLLLCLHAVHFTEFCFSFLFFPHFSFCCSLCLGLLVTRKPGMNLQNFTSMSMSKLFAEPTSQRTPRGVFLCAKNGRPQLLLKAFLLKHDFIWVVGQALRV